MTVNRPYAVAIERLRRAGLRPTRQRVALAKLLFDGPDRHVTAESLHKEATRARVRVSLATIYNSLNQFTGAGLLRQVVVDAERTYFDTNTSHHHHLLNNATGELRDLPANAVELVRLPAVPPGTRIAGIDVVIRLEPKSD
jgi:Fur family iron response transcriptional regulator